MSENKLPTKTKKVTLDIWTCEQCPHYTEMWISNHPFLADYAYCEKMGDDGIHRISYHEKIYIQDWCPLK